MPLKDLTGYTKRPVTNGIVQLLMFECDCNRGNKCRAENQQLVHYSLKKPVLRHEPEKEANCNGLFSILTHMQRLPHSSKAAL